MFVRFFQQKKKGLCVLEVLIAFKAVGQLLLEYLLLYDWNTMVQLKRGIGLDAQAVDGIRQEEKVLASLAWHPFFGQLPFGLLFLSFC